MAENLNTLFDIFLPAKQEVRLAEGDAQPLNRTFVIHNMGESTINLRSYPSHNMDNMATEINILPHMATVVAVSSRLACVSLDGPGKLKVATIG
ncbi:MAG: hypothetical protein JNM34_00245 [Chthonomonadaceae bacterium]|nr:hypothetical protein [Chthonomonadaceae bacterium]